MAADVTMVKAFRASDGTLYEKSEHAVLHNKRAELAALLSTKAEADDLVNFLLSNEAKFQAAFDIGLAPAPAGEKKR
jgi:hypothetical protein